MGNHMHENAQPLKKDMNKGPAALSISTEPPYVVGRPIGFSGWVDDFERNIAAVQFSLDGGAHWTEYGTPGVSLERGVRWQFAYTPEKAGRYLLSVRSVNGSGEASTLVSGFAFEVSEEGTWGKGADPLSHELANTPLPFGRFHIRPMGPQQWGTSKIFRSGELYGITSDEANFITQELGVRTLYDIRNEFETAAHPQPYLIGVKTVALVPNWERRRKNASKRLVAGVIGKYGMPEQRMRENYRRYAHEYPLIGKALRSMAAEGAPALVHCVNGKDRTGVLCATLLRIAGFSDEFIVADYISQNEINAAQIAEEKARLGAGMTAEEHAILMSFLEARPSYLEAFFDEAETQYDDFEGFVERGLRLTPEQQETLRGLINPS